MTKASSQSPIGYQGTAFTGSERHKFDLEGLLPAAIATIDLQIARRHALPQAPDQIADVFAAAGVKQDYGVVGDCLNGLTEAIRRQGKIERVHVRNEEAGAFAALRGGGCLSSHRSCGRVGRAARTGKPRV